MTTRLTVTIRCDEGTSRDCVRERVETHEAIDGFELIAMRLLQEGWDWDLRRRAGGRSHDVCPMCAELEASAPGADPAPPAGLAEVPA
jgi:hypothetical protein